MGNEMPLRSRRVLIVEDDEGLRRLFAGAARAMGAKVLEAGTVEEALRASGATEIDLATIDLQLGGDPHAGIPIVSALRVAHRGIAIGVVAGRGGTDEDARRRCIRAGVDLIYGKPVRYRAVLAELEEKRLLAADHVVIDATMTLEQVSARYLELLVRKFCGNVVKIARTSGLGRSATYRRLAKLDKPSPPPPG
jgi:ActR/RegA family two-component response regulator